MRRQQEQRGWAKGGVDGRCQVKVRAVGLHLDVTRWLETQVPYLRGFSNLSQLVTLQNVHPKRIELATKFMREFFEKLAEHKTSERLMRMIRDYTVGFGPKPRLGSNLLINPHVDSEDSLFRNYVNMLGQPDLLPAIPYASEARERKYAKDHD